MSSVTSQISISLDGFVAGPNQTRAAAGDNDVAIAGGASAVRQYLAGSRT
jgi:hypothetical protein